MKMPIFHFVFQSNKIADQFREIKSNENDKRVNDYFVFP